MVGRGGSALVMMLALTGCLDWNDALLKPDATIDVRVDGPGDGGQDVSDAGQDVSDAGRDVSDAGQDAPGDGAADADAATDVLVDFGPDTSLLSNGTTCAFDTECSSGHCADDVCCNTSCGAVCNSCKIPGSKGNCIAVPSGQAPLSAGKTCTVVGACGQDGLCDGLGACRNVPSGTTCTNLQCSGSTLKLAKVCDGAGNCDYASPQVGNECAPYKCNPATKACRFSCTKNPDCAVGVCSNLKCNGGLRPLGAPCGVPADCDSGFCTEGTCCESLCDGLCKTCALPGVGGRCVNVPAGQAEPSGSCVASLPCGLDGTCDGKGACRVTPAGLPCDATQCASPPDELRQHTCDGVGGCKEKKTPCGAYRCQPGAPSCFGQCVTNAQCKTGSCVGGTCQ